MNKIKKITALTLIVVMIFSFVSVYAGAESSDMIQPYTYDAETGTFTFTSLSAYGIDSIQSGMFQDAENMTKEIIIEDEGITKIGDTAFLNCFRLEKITIPETVTSISKTAFYGCEDVTIYGMKNSAAEKFADENGFTFKEVSKGKKNTEGNIKTGIEVTILGIGVVFLILIILCFVLKLFEKIFSEQNNVQNSVQPLVQQELPPVVIKENDDTELVAVITAAVAASLNTSTYNLKIRSVKRLGSSWTQNARIQNLNNNF